MSKRTRLNVWLFIVLALLLSACNDDDNISTDTDSDTDSDSEVIDNSDYTVGLLYKTSDAFDGYVLFSGLKSTTSYLVNNDGELVQSWDSDYTPQATYLLEDGKLLHTATLDAVNSDFEDAGGQTGRIEIINADNEVEWYYEVNSSTEFMHHDVEYIESSGTVLVMIWELHTAAEAEAAGRTNATDMWSEKILELDPTTNEIVWQWDAWDHLIQDENADKENYGSVADNPQLINLNFVYEDQATELDWLHNNSVDYNETLDQIVMSSHNFSEFWIIDHSTTTEQAASHSGGNRGKGGDILYRWGNPQTYDMGDSDDQKLFLQHDANWIDEGYIDGGKIMVFNNQAGTPYNENYSTVDVIDTYVNADGSYSLSDGLYLPTDFDWTYMADTPTDFYGQNISGARRLSDGNTLITEGPSGTFFEVDYNGNLVWKYVNPVDETGVLNQYDTPSKNFDFKAIGYDTDYSGLSGYDLTSEGTIEGSSD